MTFLRGSRSAILDRIVSLCSEIVVVTGVYVTRYNIQDGIIRNGSLKDEKAILNESVKLGSSPNKISLLLLSMETLLKPSLLSRDYLLLLASSLRA